MPATPTSFAKLSTVHAASEPYRTQSRHVVGLCPDRVVLKAAAIRAGVPSLIGTARAPVRANSLDMSDFDRDGLLLRGELQHELGPACSVQHSFTFAGSRDRLMPLVEDDPAPVGGSGRAVLGRRVCGRSAAER